MHAVVPSVRFEVFQQVYGFPPEKAVFIELH